MIFYDYYADVPENTLREFVSKQELGHFVTVSAEGQPHIGLYPFLFLGETIEIHLHRSDEQLKDLLTNKKCTFEVDEMHGTIPSHWIHATNAMFATAYHRTVIFECEAEVSEDPKCWRRSSDGSWRTTSPMATPRCPPNTRCIAGHSRKSPRSRCTCARAR